MLLYHIGDGVQDCSGEEVLESQNVKMSFIPKLSSRKYNVKSDADHPDEQHKPKKLKVCTFVFIQSINLLDALATLIHTFMIY